MPRAPRTLLLVLLILATGCGTSLPSPTQPATPPTVSLPPLELTVEGGEPVVTHDDAIGYLLSGALIADGSTLHLYPVAFPTAPREVPRVLHLRSADGGRTWTGERDAPTLLDGSALGLDANGPIPASGLVTSDGRWLLYGTGREPGTENPLVWKAEASGPEGPWRVDPQPVFQPSSDGWDDAITDHPSVLETEDGFLMAYGGSSVGDPNRGRIGIATSPDGVAWTRVAATNPGADDGRALGPSGCGIDARSMFEPHLLPAPGGYRLLWGAMVTGTDRMVLGSAVSRDGAAWTCDAQSPVLSPEDLPGSPGLHSFVVGDAAEPVMLVEALTEEARASDLWLVRPVVQPD